MKRIFLLSTGVLFLCISFLISSCDEGNDEIINFKTLNLDSPQNIKLDTLNRTLTWDVVPNASSYSVKHSLLDFSPATAISNSYYLGDEYVDSWQTFHIKANGSTQGTTIYNESGSTEYTFVCPVNKTLLEAPAPHSIGYTIVERPSADVVKIKVDWESVEHAGKYKYTFSHTSSGVTSSQRETTPELYSKNLIVRTENIYYFYLTALPSEGDPYINSATTVVRLDGHLLKEE